MKIKLLEIIKLYWILSFIFIVASCNSDQLILVKEGVPNYEIVYLNEPTDDGYKSVEILKTYIDKISGSNIPIVKENSQSSKNKIYVGNTISDSLKPQLVSIKSQGKDLYISGGSNEAVQNAVLVFLEEFLDCKWYAPLVESVPNMPTIAIDASINYAYSPEITTRTVHSRLFYENEDFATKQKVTTTAFPTYVPTARVHTFHRFMPEQNFYKEHPAYFALRNSKRLPTQLCLSNKDVLEIVKDSVASFFNRYPGSKVISVSQDDNTQYCQCENCSKIDLEEGGPSGSMIRFVNKVAEAFPTKTISTLAYQYTRKPSKTRPRENVLITLCSIECDRSDSIDKKCKDFTEDLIGWGTLTDNIRIWDYTTQFTNFLGPFPNMYTLQPNIQLFRDNNAKWIFEQHSNNPSELFELRSYITAKLLWNPDQDFDVLLKEFTDGYYEEGGIYVRNYIESIHTNLSKNPDFFLFLYGDPSQAFDSYLSPELLLLYTEYFDKAEELLVEKPAIQQRIKEARLSVDYAILEASKKALSPTFSLVKTNQYGSKLVNPYVAEKLESFYATAKKANISLMNEMGFTLDEYYSAYKKTIAVAQKPNKATSKKVTLFTKPKKYADEDPQVLTDGALGGSSFYANWLGFEGNHLEAVIDLEEETQISSISTAFLQVTNHIVFFPESVSYFYSNDNRTFIKLEQLENDEPLIKTSKVNDIKYFNSKFPEVSARYIKIIAINKNEAPYWHHAAGLPAWIFADEVIID